MALPSPAANPKLARILDAAYRVFSEKGYHEARVEEIAELAGVAKGTVYLYFSSKQELYLAMLDELFAAHVRALEARAAGGGSWEERLTSALEEFLATTTCASGMGVLMVNLPHACEEGARSCLLRVYEAIQTIFTGLLTEAQVERRPPEAVAPEFAARALIGMAHSFILAHYLGQQTLEPGPTAQALVRLLTRGVAPLPAG
ncbi:MAG: TetR/AcrR family transcriptional regulator [Chitinophagales bacterium]